MDGLCCEEWSPGQEVRYPVMHVLFFGDMRDLFCAFPIAKTNSDYWCCREPHRLVLHSINSKCLGERIIISKLCFRETRMQDIGSLGVVDTTMKEIREFNIYEAVDYGECFKKINENGLLKILV